MTAAKQIEQSIARNDLDPRALACDRPGRSRGPAGMDQQAAHALGLADVQEIAHMLDPDLAPVALGLNQPFFAIDPDAAVDAAIAPVPLVTNDPSTLALISAEDHFFEHERIDAPQKREHRFRPLTFQQTGQGGQVLTRREAPPHRRPADLVGERAKGDEENQV